MASEQADGHVRPLAHALTPHHGTQLCAVLLLVMSAGLRAAAQGNTGFGWGKYDDGQLLNGSSGTSSAPIQFADLTGVTAVAGGYRHSIALLA